MSKTGAAKVNTITGPIWCHYSRKNDTLKLRRIVDGTVYEFDAEESEIEDWVPLTKCKQLHPKQESYSIDATEVWAKILELLNDGQRTSVSDGNTSSVRKPTIVPVTRLRKYYGSMKVFEKAFFAAIANMYAKEPTLLEKLWNDSRRQFSAYHNQEAWTQGKRNTLPRFTGSLTDVSNTNEFTSLFMKNGLADSGYKYVEREINPWNTRQGVFANDVPATKTGRGGMDLLLQTSDGIPVVGEVKVRDDKNCLFALLQAMAYAVELSTPNQLKRLQLTYPKSFPSIDEDSMIEVAVIMVNPVPDATRKPTINLIQALNQRERCKGLKQICFYENANDHWKLYK